MIGLSHCWLAAGVIIPGWQRCIGCHQLLVTFRKRAIEYCLCDDSRVAKMHRVPYVEGTGTRPDYLANRADQKNEGPFGN